MQLGIILLVLLSAYGAAADNPCHTTEVMKLAELYVNPHLHQCQKASAGFSVAPPTGDPTDPQLKAMCASDVCQALIKDVLALNPIDCDLSFAGTKLNAYKLTRSFEEACKAGIDHDDRKYQPTPKTIENKHYSTPKPTIGKNYLTPLRTEGDKYFPTPKPTENKHYPTLKPTDDKYPTPKLTNDHHSLHKPKIVKDDHEDKPCPTHSAEKENAKEADALKPPMDGTAVEFFPMPNTTYKASVPKP